MGTRGTGYPIVVRTRYRYRAPCTRVPGYSAPGTQPILIWDNLNFSKLPGTGVSFCLANCRAQAYLSVN
eukprot:2877978-Rhodomonas_salina.1